MAKDKEKGVSLIITFFVMIIILAVVLSVSILLYGQIKVLRNIGNSVASFYAADSGIEKVLYYDRQVRAPHPTDLPCEEDNDCSSGYVCNVDAKCILKRGLCDMPSRDVNKEGNKCEKDDCTNCTISFSEQLNSASNYDVTATVKPDYSYNISSRGVSVGTSRSIEINWAPLAP